jgi:hypothetical protein
VGKPARVSDFDEVCLHSATDGRVLRAHCSLHDGLNGRGKEPQVALMKDVCDLDCSKGVVPRQLVAIKAEESALQKRSSNLLTGRLFPAFDLSPVACAQSRSCV